MKEPMLAMVNEGAFGRPTVIHFLKCDTKITTVRAGQFGYGAYVEIWREADDVKVIRVWSEERIWSEDEAIMAGIKAARGWFARRAQEADDCRTFAAELPGNRDALVNMSRYGCGWLR